MKKFCLLLTIGIFLMSSAAFAATYPDGTLLKEKNGTSVYEIKNGRKIPVPDTSVIGRRQIIEVSPAGFSLIPDMSLQSYKSISAQPYGAAQNGQAVKSYAPPVNQQAQQAGMPPAQTINAYASDFIENWRAADGSTKERYREKAKERVVNSKALNEKRDATNKETSWITRGIPGAQYYGNWCGEHWSGGANGKSEPINSIDAACKVHDGQYDSVEKMRKEADALEAKARDSEIVKGLRSPTANSTPPVSPNLIPNAKQIFEEANRFRKEASGLRKEADALEKQADMKLVGNMKTAKSNLASEFASGKGGSFYGDIEEDKKFADCTAKYFDKKVKSGEVIAGIWTVKCINGQLQKQEKQTAYAIPTQKTPMSGGATANMMAANAAQYDLANCLGPELKRRISMPISSRDEFLQLEKEVLAEAKRICGSGAPPNAAANTKPAPLSHSPTVSSAPPKTTNTVAANDAWNDCYTRMSPSIAQKFTKADSFRGGLQSEIFIEIEKYCGKAPDEIKQQILASMGNAPSAPNTVVPAQQPSMQQNQVKAYTETAKPVQQIGFTAQPIAPAPSATLLTSAKKYGDKIGSFNGVEAYSNGDCAGKVGECLDDNKWKIIAEHQCAVYAQNFYRHNFPRITEARPEVGGAWGSAAKFWQRKSYPHLVQFENGTATSLPKPGDMIFFGAKPDGHVAIVMSAGGGHIEIIQQNVYRNTAYATLEYQSDTSGRVNIGSKMASVNGEPPKNMSVLGWLSPKELNNAVASPAQVSPANIRPAPLPVAAAQAQPIAPQPQPQTSQKTPAPAPALQFNGFASNYSTTSMPYQPTISLNGSGFNSVTQISWTCAMPNGASCGVITPWTSANWSGKFIRYSDTSAVVAPMLLVTTDPRGTYHWTATFYGAGQPVIRSFAVTKN